MTLKTHGVSLTRIEFQTRAGHRVVRQMYDAVVQHWFDPSIKLPPIILKHVMDAQRSGRPFKHPEQAPEMQEMVRSVYDLKPKQGETRPDGNTDQSMEDVEERKRNKGKPGKTTQRKGKTLRLTSKLNVTKRMRKRKRKRNSPSSVRNNHRSRMIISRKTRKLP